MEESIKLRPHHLLCTQGYSGRGYSAAFVENMTAITNRLRGETGLGIQLVFSTDDICAACPKMLGAGLCESQERVELLDQKMIGYFGLEERRYIYREIVAEINGRMTTKMMDDICGDCQWYPVSACKKNIRKESMQ